MFIVIAILGWFLCGLIASTILVLYTKFSNEELDGYALHASFMFGPTSLVFMFIMGAFMLTNKISINVTKWVNNTAKKAPQ